ncbi:hypothetical protein LLG95_09575 [bacterium]|nr:hypothetical protein [bacterium]
MSAVATDQRRKILHHLKALVWCLHQMQTRYDLNLVMYSLDHHEIHPEIRDSNLGDNLAYLIDHLEPEDQTRLSETVRRLPESIGSMDIMDNHFEVGHYLQAKRRFGPVAEGHYGIIASITPQLRGLFYLEDGHIANVPFDPSAVRCIFGTYIV